MKKNWIQNLTQKMTNDGEVDETRPMIGRLDLDEDSMPRMIADATETRAELTGTDLTLENAMPQ